MCSALVMMDNNGITSVCGVYVEPDGLPHGEWVSGEGAPAPASLVGVAVVQPRPPFLEPRRPDGTQCWGAGQVWRSPAQDP